jgi:predicted GH43/DUF377 family glycosyl hydrolase
MAIDEGTTGATVGLTRSPKRPVIDRDVIPGSNAIFNAGACRCGDDTALLARVEDRRGHSSVWVLRSRDGIGDWRPDPTPLLAPNPDDDATMWGFEDARVVWLEELGTYAITCTAYGPAGPSVYLALTDDLIEVTAARVVQPPEDKNAALFPRRFDGDWLMLHRPVSGATRGADIWMSRSRDLEAWRAPLRVMSRRSGGWWDAARIGIGPPPIERPEGWLLVYHGVRQTTAGAVYRAGVCLLDRDDPSRLLGRAPDWILTPDAPYERVGDVNNVVFPCGCVTDGDEIVVYYGAADTCVGRAVGSLQELTSACLHGER